MNDICNGVPDCTENDDEFLCLPSSHKCPPSCSCFFLALHCLGTKFSPNGMGKQFFLLVHFHNHTEHNSRLLLSKFVSAVILVAHDCGLKKVCHNSYSAHIAMMNFSSNIIESLMNECFKLSTKIKSLSLNKNKIMHLGRRSLCNLQVLSYLDLSDNNISDFSSSTIGNVVSIFILENNPLQGVSAESFLGLTVKVFKTEKYSLCCVVESISRCTAQKLWNISCANLLSSISGRSTLYTVSFTVFICNVVCVFIHRNPNKKGTEKISTFRHMAISLSFADLTCAAYQIILCIFDTVYRKDFVLKEKVWRSSAFCLVAFGLSLCFSILSPVLLTLLAMARFKLVKHPLGSEFKKTSFVMKNLSGLWSISVIVSISFTLFFTYQGKTIPNNLCSPFFDITHTVISMKVVTWTTVVLKMAAVTIMFVLCQNDE